MTNQAVKFIINEEDYILVDAENICKLEPEHIVIKTKKVKTKLSERIDYIVYNKITKESVSITKYLFEDGFIWKRKVINHDFTRSNMRSRPARRTAKRKWIYFDRFNNKYNFCIEKNGKKYKGSGYRIQSDAIRAFNQCMKRNGFPERLDREINK